MILGRAASNGQLHPLRDSGRRRRVERVVEAFAAAFPEIVYDVLWPSRTLNAQAFLLDGRKHVRLYGGLARHKAVSVAGIAWLLAHETGHHVGGAPFDPHYPWLSSEERADAWATDIGLRRIFGAVLAHRYATHGQREARCAVGA